METVKPEQEMEPIPPEAPTLPPLPEEVANATLASALPTDAH